MLNNLAIQLLSMAISLLIQVQANPNVSPEFRQQAIQVSNTAIMVANEALMQKDEATQSPVMAIELTQATSTTIAQSNRKVLPTVPNFKTGYSNR